MKHSQILMLIGASLIFIACKKELEPQESSVVDSTAVATAPAPAVTSQPAQPSQPAQQSQTVQPAQPVVMPTQPATPQPVKKGMNPAHGQPGHRCEIPVGAPLNSAAPAKSQPVTITQKTPQATQTTTATPAILSPNAAPAQATAPGMNPPHGQEGHRCDIAVGAPLNSEKK